MPGRPKRKARTMTAVMDSVAVLACDLFIASENAKELREEWLAATHDAMKTHIALEELVRRLHEVAGTTYTDFETLADQEPELDAQVTECDTAADLPSVAELLSLAEQIVLDVHAATPSIYREKCDKRYPLSFAWAAALASVLRLHHVIRDRLVRAIEPDALTEPSRVAGIWPAGGEEAFRQFMKTVDAGDEESLRKVKEIMDSAA